MAQFLYNPMQIYTTFITYVCVWNETYLAIYSYSFKAGLCPYSDTHACMRRLYVSTVVHFLELATCIIGLIMQSQINVALYQLFVLVTTPGADLGFGERSWELISVVDQHLFDFVKIQLKSMQ